MSPGMSPLQVGQPGGILLAVGFVKEVVTLLVDAGQRLRAARLFPPSQREDAITYELQALIDGALVASGSDLIECDVQADVRHPGGTPQQRKRLDFRFRYRADFGKRPPPLLVAEGKRLRGKGATLSGPYVEEGLMRFVRAEYAPAHSHGIMLGYVEVGPTASAVSGVTRALASRQAMSCQTVSFHLNNQFSAHPHTHHSTHNQPSTGVDITLIHLFLDLQ